jgi:hypothetical protein
MTHHSDRSPRGDSKGPTSRNWKGGVVSDGQGYMQVYVEGHSRRYVRRAVLIAEQALGKRLPKKAQVHHFDEDKSNDANTNLVVCEDLTYHKLLHRRQRIVALGGDPDLHQVCCKCKAVLPFSAFAKNRSTPTGFSAYCRSCKSVSDRRYSGALCGSK